MGEAMLNSCFSSDADDGEPATASATALSGRAYFAVGIVNSAPFGADDAQRCITLFCLV